MTARAPRVLIAGLYHETHTFVPGRTGLADFAIRRGSELWEAAGDTSPLGGALEAAQSCGWEIVPAIDSRARPSGTVKDEVLEAWWREFETAARAAVREGPLQGIFLVLHGAMVTESCADVEGELLERTRALPGLSDIPLGGVTDLHANVSDRMARYSNALVTYRQNPHADARETAIRAVGILDRLMRTERPARTFWRPVPMLLPPTMTGTADNPMRALEVLARQIEAAEPDLLSVSVHAGFAFADTPDTGVSFTVNGFDEAAARSALEALARMALETPADGAVQEVSVPTAMEQLARQEAGPVLLIEPSDNIGAGAPGEGATLLRALVEHRVPRAGVIINDPNAVRALSARAPGERATLRIGGRSSPLYDGPCELEVELVSRSDGRFTLEDPHSHQASMQGSRIEMGPCALVRHEGVIILLTSRPTAPFDLGQWRSQGVAPEGFFAIGIKAAVAHRQAYDPITRTSLYVRTPGPCSSELRDFPYQKVRRPIRPLDL